MKSLALAFLLWSTLAAAETPAGDPYASIDALLDSNDVVDQRKGAAAIGGLIKEGAATPASQPLCSRFLSQWHARLLSKGLTDDALALARVVILAHPEQTADVEALLRGRVTSLLAHGRNDEAAQDAKSLYNVSSLATLEKNALLVRDALRAIRTPDSDLVRRFKLEQLIVVDSEAPNPKKHNQDQGEHALGAIQIDSRDYDTALEDAPTQTDRDLLALGNLLLVIDQNADARKVFERVYKTGPKEKRAEVVERIAAAYKAEDGSPLRAKEWLATALEILKKPPEKKADKKKDTDPETAEPEEPKPAPVDSNAPPPLPEIGKK